MITAIGLYLAVSAQLIPGWDSREERLAAIMAAQFAAPPMPNGYRAGDAIPYMPGSGDPLIGRENPIESKMRLIAK